MSEPASIQEPIEFPPLPPRSEAHAPAPYFAWCAEAATLLVDRVFCGGDVKPDDLEMLAAVLRSVSPTSSYRRRTGIGGMSEDWLHAKLELIACTANEARRSLTRRSGITSENLTVARRNARRACSVAHSLLGADVGESPPTQVASLDERWAERMGQT